MEKGISLSLKKFIAHFCEGIRQEKRFCFILGAGASKSSGIPTGAELAKKWIAELEEQDNDDLEEWLKENQIDKNDYATHYSDIFAKRFELSPKNGFAFLESVISDAEPSCGYSFLAQILAKDKHNIVITTNFDSLTEDALFIYTQKKPLVIGHSALADYITATPSRPLVIKIHHDLFLSPKNTTEETSELDEKITNGLKEIFKRYTPLVIGYGGNDGSLMNFLKKLGHFEEGIFWFYIHEEDIKPEVKELVKHAKGHFVRINGFDHLMVQLGNQLGLEQLDGMIESIAKNRAKRYRKQVEDLNKLETTDTETKKAMGEITSRGEKSWWSYALEAGIEKNIKKADFIYREGIKEFPNSSELLGEYAVFLKNIKKDYLEAEKYYQKSLELNPDDANVNGNYANFLNAIKQDYAEAEKYYQKSLGLNPDDTNVNGNYANFLCNIKKDYLEAEKYYQKSLELNPDDANVNGNYANFLNAIKQDYAEAEKYYQKSLGLNPDDSNVNGNYALFLNDIRKDYAEAEKYYQKSLGLNPDDSNVNGNYALFLNDIRKDYAEAEKYYQKSLELNPDDANANGNYANFLNVIKKDYAEAEKYYQKSLELNPDAANFNGNYALFLNAIKQDYAEAEKYYQKSLELNPDAANVNGNYAIFLNDIKQDYAEAEKYYQKSLELNPDDANVNGNYAVFLKDIKKDYLEAEKYYQKSLELNPDAANVNGNYAIFLKDIKQDYVESEKYYLKSLELDSVDANYNSNYAEFLLIYNRKKEALKFIKKAFGYLNEGEESVELELWFYCFVAFPKKFPESRQKIEELLNRGVTSIGWDLSEIVKIAEKEKHPEIEKVKEFAKRISGEG